MPEVEFNIIRKQMTSKYKTKEKGYFHSWRWWFLIVFPWINKGWRSWWACKEPSQPLLSWACQFLPPYLLSIPPILFIVKLEGKQLSDASPKSESLSFLPSLPPSPLPHPLPSLSRGEKHFSFTLLWAVSTACKLNWQRQINRRKRHMFLHWC